MFTDLGEDCTSIPFKITKSNILIFCSTNNNAADTLIFKLNVTFAHLTLGSTNILKQYKFKFDGREKFRFGFEFEGGNYRNTGAMYTPFAIELHYSYTHK